MLVHNPIGRMEWMEGEAERLGYSAKIDKEQGQAVPYIRAALRQFERVTECPMCGGTDFEDYGPAELVWEYYRCRGCGLIFQTFYMPHGVLEAYYKDIYRLCVRPFNGGVTDKQVYEETDSGIKYLVRSGAKPSRHLDIGCSTGSFLRVMAVAYECEVVGVEPGDKFREYSKQRGIPTFKDISEVGGKFDFISMCHVLEHLIKPMEMLATIKDLLEDDGRIYIEVPTCNLAFSHPLVFEGDMLTKMLNRAGFDIINIETTEKYMFASAKKGI